MDAALAEPPDRSLPQLIAPKALGAGDPREMFARERRVAQLSKDEYGFHSEIGSIVGTPDELRQPLLALTGAERRGDARSLKDYSVIAPIVDYVFQQGGASRSQVMTMCQGSDRSVTIHIAGGTEGGNRVVVPVQGRGQVGKGRGHTRDYRGARLERVARTKVGVPPLQQVRLPPFRPPSITSHLHDDSVRADRENRPVARGNRRRPRTISLRTFRGGFRRTESGESDRTAQCCNCQKHRLVDGNRACIMKRASDERDEVAIAQPRVPRPIRIGRRITHPDSEIRLRAHLYSQTGLDAQEIRKAQPLYFRRPDLVRSAIALKLDGFEPRSAKSLHRPVNTCGTHAQKTEETRVGLEGHQRSAWPTCSRCAGSTPSACASEKMFSTETFRLPRSTELM